MISENVWYSSTLGTGAHWGLIGFPGLSILFILGLIWVIGLKGYALWHAAKRNEQKWFIALLVINTAGLLEIIYLMFFAKVLLRDVSKIDEGAAPHKTHNNEGVDGRDAGEKAEDKTAHKVEHKTE